MYRNDYDKGYEDFLRRNRIPEGQGRPPRPMEITPEGALLAGIPLGLYSAYHAMQDGINRADAAEARMYDPLDDYYNIDRERAMQEAIDRRRMMYGDVDGLYR